MFVPVTLFSEKSPVILPIEPLLKIAPPNTSPASPEVAVALALLLAKLPVIELIVAPEPFLIATALAL